MNCIQEKLNAFASNLKHVDIVLKEAGKEVIGVEQQIFSSLDECSEHLKSIINNREISEGKPFTKKIEEIMSEWQQAVLMWKNSLKDSSKVRDDLSRYGEGLIIAVFGRTNAGKSTLGNFIKGKSLIDAEFDNPWKHDDFRAGSIKVIASKSDSMEDITDKEWFAEGSVETTKEIQLFSLPGFTWVDTPGFGSLNKELGGLAKKYVERADVIIYLEHSNNPGLKSITQDLVPYLEKAHEVLLVINHSDKLGPPEIDPSTGDFIFGEDERPVQKIVPKAEEDRLKQENQVKSALKDLGYSGDCSSLSISMLLTNKGISNNDYETFKGGNIESLFSKIENLIKTDKDIIRLKFKDGRLSLINLISAVRKGSENNSKSMTSLIDEMKNFRNNAEIVFNKFDPEKITRNISIPIITELKSELTTKVSRLMDSENSSNEKGIQKKVESEIKLIIKKTIENTNSAVQKKASDLLKDLFVNSSDELLLTLPELTIPQVKKITEEFEYEVSDVEYELRDPEGIIENVCSVFGKKYYSAEKVTRIETKTVDLGLNTDDVLEALHRELPNQITMSINKLLTDIKNEGANYTLGILDAMLQELISTDKKLIDLSNKLNKEMESF